MLTLWDEPIINPDDADALQALRRQGVRPSETILLGHAYRDMAIDISDDPAIRVAFVDTKEESGYAWRSHRIDLYAGSVADAPGLDWLDLLHGEFWHELGHALYSKDLCSREPARTGVLDQAENLLEDIRIERRLVEEHPPTRSWLRANVIGRWYREDVIRQRSQPAEHGWARIATILSGRVHSGVLTGLEKQRLAQLFMSLPHVERLRFAAVDEVWKAYAELGDADAAGPEVDELVEALASYFTSHSP